MTKLTEYGYKVLFVEPVVKKKFYKSGLNKISDSLYILHSFGLPYERCLNIINSINSAISHRLIDKAVKEIGFDDYLVIFDRIHGCDYKYYLKTKYTVYDLVDEILAFGRYRNERMLISIENKVIRNCSLLTSSSTTLLNRKLKQGRRDKDYMFIPNGVDASRFKDIKKKRQDQNIENVVLGFIGQISERSIDAKLIKEIAVLRPQWTIELIGPGYENNMFEDIENVQVKKPVSKEEIPELIASFDCGIIPYVTNNSTMDYVFPRKACEYLSAGIPVVSTELAEIECLKPYVKTAIDAKGFVECVEKSLNEKTDPEEIKSFAQKYDWDNLIQGLLDVLEKDM